MQKKEKREFKKRLNRKGSLKSEAEISNSKSLKLLCMTAAAVLITTASIQLAPNDTYTNPGVDYDTNFVVAHAGGALEEDGDELNYLNSLEGFYHYYAEGTRLFEFDLVFSSDGRLVGAHTYEYLDGYSMKNRIGYQEYKNTKIAGKFEGITEESLLALCKIFPECKFIIDTKEKDPTAVYYRIIDLAKQQDLDISKTILPFVSSKDMLLDLEKRYDFEEIMFTNYKNYYSTRQLLNIVKEFDKIRYVHIFPIDFFRVDIEKLNQQGVRVFAHMDKENFLRTALDYGCTGIFSDNISEKDFKENHYSFLANKLEIVQEQVVRERKVEMFYKRNESPELEF